MRLNRFGLTVGGAVLFLVMLSASVRAADTAPRTVPESTPDAPDRVACVGDSITYGANVDRQTEAYPAQLQALLGKKYDVRNFGIGSATLIKTGKPNVWQQLDKIKAFKPNIVVIALGTNDTVGGRRRNWEKIDRFDSDYADLISQLSQISTRPRIFVCTPTAMVLQTPGLSEGRLANLKQRKPRMGQLCKRIKALAEANKDKNVEILDLNPIFQQRPDLIVPKDGVHPNAAGYRFIAEYVAAQVNAPNWDRWPAKKATWKDYPQYHFTVDGRRAYIVTPKTVAPGRPWIWRMRFPGYHADMDLTLLGKGYHIGYIDMANMFGSPTAMRHMDAFYLLLTIRHGLSRRPVLEGVSRGGLFVYNWAARNPHKVSSIYCDTPVCDIKSWPGGKGTGVGSTGAWAACLKAYGFTEQQGLEHKANPIDHAQSIAAAKIPILHIVSHNDVVVPPKENTLLLKHNLLKHGWDLEVIDVAEGTAKSKGHHFTHPDPARVVKFILKNTR